MKRRYFLNLATGLAAAAIVFTASAQAAPLSPRPLVVPVEAVQPAVVSGDEVAHLKPQEVRYGHHGYHHRHWHHHGYRHHRWHRHHWHHRWHHHYR